MDLQVGRTAVVVTVPGAQPLLDRAAVEFGVTAAALMPAHVTVLYPWLDPDAVTASDLEALAEICSREPAFDVVLDRFDAFPGVLWAVPEPADPFVRLTRAIAGRWPHLPPYGGVHAGVTPHLSVLDLEAVGIDVADETAVKDAVERLMPWLPVVHRVDAVEHLLFEGDGCRTLSRIPLGA